MPERPDQDLGFPTHSFVLRLSEMAAMLSASQTLWWLRHSPVTLKNHMQADGPSHPLIKKCQSYARDRTNVKWNILVFTGFTAVLCRLAHASNNSRILATSLSTRRFVHASELQSPKTLPDTVVPNLTVRRWDYKGYRGGRGSRDFLPFNIVPDKYPKNSPSRKLGAEMATKSWRAFWDGAFNDVYKPSQLH